MTTKVRTGRVVVTGIGLRTPLGAFAAQSAASIRAGLSAFREWPHFGAAVGEEAGIPAAPVAPDLGDLPWHEKAVPLLQPALREALWSARLWELPRDGVQGFLALPYPDRAGTSADAFPTLAAELAEDWVPDDETPLRTDVFALDQAGGLVAVAAAIELLAARKLDIAIVGGVDSLLHGPLLEELFAAGRLKVGERPSGLVPGEAAAVVVLESESVARRRKVPALAQIEAVALDQDAPYRPDAPIHAEALTRALRAVLQHTDGGDVRRVLTDLNGERWRFLEWATAETRCLDKLPPRKWQLWHPADSIGDTGAAFGPLAIALCARAFARGYAGGGKVLIAASSERGERAAMSLSPPAPPEKP